MYMEDSIKYNKELEEMGDPFLREENARILQQEVAVRME
jgi:succinate dehydrogenase/fumarate reductase flavoprotein subunit